MKEITFVEIFIELEAELIILRSWNCAELTVFKLSIFEILQLVGLIIFFKEVYLSTNGRSFTHV